MKKIILSLIAVIIFSAAVNAANQRIYAEIRDTSPAPSKMNIGDTFRVDIKFNAGDTIIQSLTTLMTWDASAIQYISQTNNSNWDLYSSVDNINPIYSDNNPGAGIFFWDCADSDGFTGIQTAHTLTFQILQKKSFKFEIILGNVVPGGFSGSGLRSISSLPEEFLANVTAGAAYVDFIAVDTPVIISTNQ